MASSAMANMVWMLAALVTTVKADGFLSGRQSMQKDVIDQMLLSQLSTQSNQAEIGRIQEELRPLYAALPKNENGKLAPSVARYAVQRYFTHKHGWHIKGLGHNTENNSSSASILKEQAPFYIQRAFEERMHSGDMGLHELSVFASTLTNLIRKDVVGVLEHIYDARSLSRSDFQSPRDFDKLIEIYLALHIKGVEHAHSLTRKDLLVVLDDVKTFYLDWDASIMWALDLRRTLEFTQHSRRNPFVSGVTYSHAVEYVQEMSHRFKSTQDSHCNELKNRLVDMEQHGSGRVPLAQFYSGYRDDAWPFWEKVEYLRALGALDEADGRMPSVIIPNYIGGHGACLEPSGFYSVCCPNECESLMSHMEKVIAAPDSTPAQVVEVIQHLSSETVIAPRNLSTSLVGRLTEIAVHHGGRVPLHGRLFAQWMHHAYPRECPYPHVSGTTKQATRSEWDKEFGEDSTEATDEEMQVWVEEDYVPEKAQMPWSGVEELVNSRQHLESFHGAGTWSKLRAFALLAVVVASLSPVVRSSSPGAPGVGNKKEVHLV